MRLLIWLRRRFRNQRAVETSKEAEVVVRGDEAEEPSSQVAEEVVVVAEVEVEVTSPGRDGGTELFTVLPETDIY